MNTIMTILPLITLALCATALGISFAGWRKLTTRTQAAEDALARR